MPLALLLLLLVGGGTGVAAENSLPGDTLYPVKIHVNEKLESVLAVTDKGNAEVASKQATRRLEEAEKLRAILGTTTPAQNIALQNALSKEINSFNNSVLKIKNKDSKSADAITAKFERKIDDHFDTLIGISGTGSTTPELKNIIFLKKGRGEKGGWVYINASSTTATSTPMWYRIKSKEDGERKEVKKIEVKREDGDRGEHRGRDGDDDEDEDEDRPRTLPPVVVTPPPATGGTGTTIPPVPPTVVKYTLAQVAGHSTSADCWSVVSGGVYNLTSWIAQHPGGQSSIKGMCGVDATAGFMAQHGGQGNPASELAAFKIGVLQ